MPLVHSLRPARQLRLSEAQFFFQHIGGRVHKPLVNITELGHVKKSGGMIGISELVGCCLINRNNTGTGYRICLLASMQNQSFYFLTQNPQQEVVLMRTSRRKSIKD